MSGETVYEGFTELAGEPDLSLDARQTSAYVLHVFRILRNFFMTAQINIDYRGYVISHDKIPQMTNSFMVNLASNDRGLLARIGGGGQGLYRSA